MESLVPSGAPDAPIIAKPGARERSQSFGVPSIEVVLSKPSNTGVLLTSVFLHFDVVDLRCAFVLIDYALLVFVMDVVPSNIDLIDV